MCSLVGSTNAAAGDDDHVGALPQLFVGGEQQIVQVDPGMVTASVPERRSMLYSELLTCGSEEEKTLSRAELKAVVEVLAAVFSALAASLSEVEVAEIELPTVRRLLRLVAALVFCCVKIASASDPPGTFPSPAFCSWVRI